MSISNYTSSFAPKIIEPCFDLTSLTNQIRKSKEATEIKEKESFSLSHCWQICKRYFKRIHKKYPSLNTSHIETLANKLLETPSLSSFIREKTLLKNTLFNRIFEKKTPLGEIFHELQKSQESPYRKLLNEVTINKAEKEAKKLLTQISKENKASKNVEINDMQLQVEDPQINVGQRELFSTSNVVKEGKEFQINTYTLGGQGNPSVANLNNGKFVAVWQSYDGSGWGIYGQIYNADGSKNGKEFLVNTNILNSQRYPAISKVDNDKFVVTWESYIGNDIWGIYGQIFNVDSKKSGGNWKFIGMTYRIA